MSVGGMATWVISVGVLKSDTPQSWSYRKSSKPNKNSQQDHVKQRVKYIQYLRETACLFPVASFTQSSILQELLLPSGCPLLRFISELANESFYLSFSLGFAKNMWTKWMRFKYFGRRAIPTICVLILLKQGWYIPLWCNCHLLT